jgi:ketosteroid isomerase-like protein
MAQSFPSAVGRSSIREAYDRIFSAITLSVEFDIIEVVLVFEAWAFARMASKGTTVVKAGGGIKEAYQELFVLRRVDVDWKIARYCFCTTNPPH